MPYNYIDFIRDQARRNAQRKASGYVNDVTEMIPASRAAQIRNDLSNTRAGTNYFHSSRYGADLSLRQLAFAKRNLDQAAGQDERVNNIFYRNAQREGTASFGPPPTKYGYGAATPSDSASHPTPARRALEIAAAGNAQLNDGDARAQAISTGKNVLATSGATYFPSGGYARTRPLTDTVKDFSSPVINPDQAASYLNASRNPTGTVASSANPVKFNPVEGTSIDAANPAVPIVGTEPRPLAAPDVGNAYRAGQAVVGAIEAAPRAIDTGVTNAFTALQRNVGVPAYNFVAGAVGAQPAEARPYIPLKKPDNNY